MNTPAPELRRVRLRWWPLVRLTSEQRPAGLRWKLQQSLTGKKKTLLLTSPRGRQWRVMMSINKQRGTWIEPLPLPQP